MVGKPLNLCCFKDIKGFLWTITQIKKSVNDHDHFYVMLQTVCKEKTLSCLCLVVLLISMRYIISQKCWSCVLPSNYVSISIQAPQMIHAVVQEESNTKVCMLEGLLISTRYIIPQKCWSCVLATNYSSMSIHTAQIIQATVQEESSTKIWVLEGLLISMRYSETHLRCPLLRKFPP
jgi:hypothetical protein